MPSLAECVLSCLYSREFVEGFNRLSGCHIDQTGFAEENEHEDEEEFVLYVKYTVYGPLLALQT